MKTFNFDWTLALGALVPWASVAAAGWLTPRLTRPDLFFAVTVNSNFRQSPSGREILRGYNRFVFSVTFLAFLLIGLTQMSATPVVLLGLLGPVYVELGGLFVAFQLARHRALPFHVEATTEREANLQPRAGAKSGGWLFEVGPFLILAGIIFLLYARGSEIPMRIPIHWGANGLPNGWGAKSVASVFGGAVIGALTCALIAALRCGIANGARRVHGSGARGQWEERFIRVSSLVLLAVEYWLALLFGFFSLMVLRHDPAAPLPALLPIMVGPALLLGSIILIAWRTGQGGWKLGGATENKLLTENAPIGDRTPDKYWKLGVFYCNPNDPALFVEKRFGFGWTLNMSNRKAWLVLGALLLFVVASLTVALLAGK
jgi:uncharacterized membrane protein